MQHRTAVGSLAQSANIECCLCNCLLLQIALLTFTCYLAYCRMFVHASRNSAAALTLTSVSSASFSSFADVAILSFAPESEHAAAVT